MKYLKSLILLATIPFNAMTQLNHQNVYIPKSCPGELIKEKVYFENHGYDSEKYYYQGSNIPGLNATINGEAIDTSSELIFNDRDEIEIDIEFEITRGAEYPQLFYKVVTDRKTYKSSFPIHIGTYTIDSRQKYLQTNNACTENVQWALPFYGTQTDIRLYNITDDNKTHVLSTTFYCCSGGNLITMPKDTKGTFLIEAQGCWAGGNMSFDVNTISPK